MRAVTLAFCHFAAVVVASGRSGTALGGGDVDEETGKARSIKRLALAKSKIKREILTFVPV